jgi:hypothetical protein
MLGAGLSCGHFVTCFCLDESHFDFFSVLGFTIPENS